MNQPGARQSSRGAVGVAVAIAVLAAVVGAGVGADEAVAAKSLRLTSNPHGIVFINGVMPRTIGQVSRQLGERPSARRPVAGASGFRCTVRWARAGLTLGTSNWDREDPCADRTGNALSLTVSGRQWVTARGLRVGASMSRLRARYPNTRREHGRWTLTTYTNYGSQQPAISAAVRGGKVRSFQAGLNWGSP